MHNKILEGKWDQLKGSIQKQWGKLTNDDLDQINGDFTKLQGKLKEHYGLTADEAKKEFDKLFKK